MSFLFPLGIGVVTGIFLFGKGVDYLLTNYFEPTQFFFLGLIIGVIPFLMKEADTKTNFKGKHYLVLIIAFALFACLGFIKTNENADPITTLNLMSTLGLFFSGWLASMAMLMPGISGSFVLLLLGVYSTAINALSTLNIPIILTIGTGVIIGFIVSSKGIQYLLSHHRMMTYAVIIGLIIGSVFIIFPGMPEGTMFFVSLITFICGLVLSLIFGKLNERRTKEIHK